MSNTLDRSLWQRILGYKQGEEFPLAESLDPVVIVGDHRSATPVVRAPTATWGGNVDAEVGQHATFEFFGRGAALLVQNLHLFGPAAGRWVVMLRATGGVFDADGPDDLVPGVEYGAPVARVRSGRTTTAAVLQTALNPTLQLSNIVWPEIYVPPGRFLVIECTTGNQVGNMCARVTEPPSLRAA